MSSPDGLIEEVGLGRVGAECAEMIGVEGLVDVGFGGAEEMDAKALEEKECDLLGETQEPLIFFFFFGS